MASRVVAVVEHPAAENRAEYPRRRRGGGPEGQEHIEFS
jgi:hypothetical protein